MLIPVHNLKHLYQHILKTALEQDGQGCTIYIFVSNDTDSVVSLKILTTLLKSDEVQYVAIPVFSNSHIQRELEKLADAKYLRTLIFINCGGYIDMTSQWFYERSNIKCYLSDSHRPYNHRNVNDDQQKIFVVHDGCKSFDECPTAEDDRIYHEIKAQVDSDEDEYGSEMYSDEEEI